MKTPISSSFLRCKESRHILKAGAAALLAALGPVPSAHSQIVVPGTMTYTQNFDSLGTAQVAWTDNVTIPGWFAGINANATADGNLTVSDGSTATPTGLLNLGASAAADRALGSKATSTGTFANIAYGVLFQNTSGRSLDITNITYAGELWRSNASAGGLAEQWVTFTKVAAATFSDVEPGASGAAANVGTFTASGSPWLSPDAPNATPDAQADGNLEANRVVISNDPNILILPNQFFMFRWVDTNLGGSDGQQGIDDFSISFTSISNLVYNLAHTVGGSPNGVLEISASAYWTDVATPSGFANGSQITFSQAGTATISVPADVTPLLTTVSAASGTYTIGGAGKINGPLTKSGAGTLVLTSANDFTTATISGGIVELRAPGALGTGQLTINGVATLNIRDNGSGDNGQIDYGNNITISSGTTINLDRAAGGTSVGNTVAFGSLAIGPQTLTVTGANGYKVRFDGNVTLSGTASINTNTEVTMAASISGSFGLAKTGTGRLVLDAVNTFTGALTVNGGTVGGTGTLTGALTINAATLAPGNGQGTFATNSNLTLSATSTFSLELSHGVAALPEPGTDYDQMLVGTGVGNTSTGTVTLSGGTLALTIGSGIQVNDIFYVIINDGVDPIAGTGAFAGLPQGATISAGGHTFSISYRADSVTGAQTGGNDVALVVVPEPGTALLALFGACGLLAGRRRRR